MTAIDKSRADIAQELRELSARMYDMAADMDYYSEHDPEMFVHSKELRCASQEVFRWAHAIEKEGQQ